METGSEARHEIVRGRASVISQHTLEVACLFQHGNITPEDVDVELHGLASLRARRNSSSVPD